jgi:hypothetical protein
MFLFHLFFHCFFMLYTESDMLFPSASEIAKQVTYPSLSLIDMDCMVITIRSADNLAQRLLHGESCHLVLGRLMGLIGRRVAYLI